MPLSVGDRLGPYEIVALLGAGGMGEVYRARDLRLRRDVALKISAERFSERFDREARAIAALNHPNICTLYDIGPNYLVMELVEGSSPRGPTPLEEALRIAGQIADALVAAHEKGFVHRDLKPANVKITPGGLVKVLDFGLAKRNLQASADRSTVTMGLTEAGTAVGTPAYMAPEQAQGQEVDKRADVWAFGVLLYELLTGRHPFQGDTMQATFAAVLSRDPDLEEAPPSVRRLLQACLKKDPRERLSSIGDWRFLLDQDERLASRVAKSRMPWLVAAAAVIAAGVALWAPWRPDLGVQIGEPLMRIDADLGTGVSLFAENGPAVALSRDGAKVAFSSRTEDGNIRLYWRRLDQANATALSGTESAFAPFFSPNGEQIAFFSEGSLKKVDLSTGGVTVLASAINPAGGTWGEDGVIVFHRAPTLDLWTVSANGGEMKPLPHKNPRRRFWPQLLPGGKALLATSPAGFDMPEEVDAVSLVDGESRTLVKGAHFGRYLSSGHLAYLRGGTLFVRFLDPKRLELSGPEVPLLQGVEYSTVDASGQFDVAANGTLIYRAARPGSELKTVQWIDSVGHLEPLLAPPGDYRAIALSRDGKRLALTIAQSGVSDLYVYDLERRQQPGRLTVGAKISSGVPVAWSPDGRYLFFTASDTIWWVPTERLSQPHEFLRTYSVSTISPDGKRLFAMKTTPHNRVDAWIVPVTVDLNGPRAGQPVPLLQGPVSEANCDGSLDGRWATCMTDDTGIAQIYVIEIANPGRWLVSSGSGYWSAWANPGHEIFYTTFFAPLRIMVTPYSLEGGHFQPGQPRQWSPVGVPSHDSAGLTDLTMTPDGKRFAALMPAEEPLGNRVTFVMNFFDEVRRRIAAK